MPLLNKEKMMSGFGKAVDAVNRTADRADQFAREKELDKKVKHAADAVDRGIRKVEKNVKDYFSDKKSKQ